MRDRRLGMWRFTPLLVALAGAASAMPVTGDPERGKALYGVCTGYHSIDDNDIGPRHRGVVGRRAGSVAGYHYSPALAGSGLLWTPANLDRWLSGTQSLVPGARMYFYLGDAQKRADIIAFLATQN